MLEKVEVKTLFIEPGSPREDGYIKSFNGKFRDELSDGEIFDTLLEAKVLIERWRVEYNTIRPHSALGYRLPAPETIQERNQHNVWFHPWGQAKSLNLLKEMLDPLGANSAVFLHISEEISKSFAVER